MSERPHPFARELNRGFIAREITFEEGIIVFDSQEHANRRADNRARLTNPKNGYIKNFRPFSGNQEVYDTVAKVNRQSMGFGQGKEAPRGYSKAYKDKWNTINKQNSTKAKTPRKAG